MEYAELTPFLLSLTPPESPQSHSDVDLNSYKSIFNLTSWVPASIIETQIEAVLRSQSQASVPMSQMSLDSALAGISLPMLIEAVANSEVLMQVNTDLGVEVTMRPQWSSSPYSSHDMLGTPVRAAQWHSDKKPTRHFDGERGKVMPVRLTEAFSEDELRKDVKVAVEEEMGGRRGEDLYVLRTDGVEKVYKNNSQYYLQKKTSHRAHLDRMQKLQQHNDNFYTPKSRQWQRPEVSPPSSYPPQKKAHRKRPESGPSANAETVLEDDRGPVECLEMKFARISLQDITNVQLQHRPLRQSSPSGN